jgi:[ribosomal protein S5]-alanine N-acetyltransferase
MARPIVRGELVALWRPRADERREFLQAVAASRPLHAEWVHPPRDAVGYGEFLRRARARDRVTFVARRVDDRRLVGVVNVNNISMGAFCSASLGYYGFVGGCGEGRMTESVGLAVEQCFDLLGLHRVEANVQPGNDSSQRLVERLGFRFEGFSPRMLFIGGEWRDHNRFALTIEDHLARPVRGPLG